MNKQKNLSAEEKIVKNAKTLKIISKVLYVMSCVICLAFIVLAIVLPLTCKFENYTSAEVALIFGGLALYTFFLIGVLWNVEYIFISIEEAKSPFGEKVTKYIKKTGIFLILLSVVPAIIQGTLVAILAKDSNINSVIQTGGIIAGVVLYYIGYFFEYGADLKKRDDQTL